MSERKSLPVLPLRDIVVFPQMVAPLFVGRDKSVRALEEVGSEGGEILLVAQKDAGTDDPVAEDLFETGAIATILQLLKLPDGTVKVLVEGKQRAKLRELIKGIIIQPILRQSKSLLRKKKAKRQLS